MTLAEFLEFHNVMKKFCINIVRERGINNITPLISIGTAFSWDGSIEGYQFWQKFSLLASTLPSRYQDFPVFKDYCQKHLVPSSYKEIQ